MAFLAGVNRPLVLAALLIIGLGVFHSLLGELYLVRRLLRRDNLPKLFGADSFTKITIRYAWHLTTLLCIAVGALLLWASLPSAPEGSGDVILVLNVTLLAGGVWGIVATRGRHLSWIVLVLAAGLAWFGVA